MTFDTGAPALCPSGGCGDKFFVFWVVAWLEGQDGSGNPVLVRELADHGLTGDLNAPNSLKSIADICPTANCDASCGICMEEFTNNVGFYHVAFYVAPQTTQATLAPRLRRRGASGAGFVHQHLAIDRVSVTPTDVRPGQKAVVRPACAPSAYTSTARSSASTRCRRVPATSRCPRR